MGKIDKINKRSAYTYSEPNSTYLKHTYSTTIFRWTLAHRPFAYHSFLKFSDYNSQLFGFVKTDGEKSLWT